MSVEEQVIHHARRLRWLKNKKELLESELKVINTERLALEEHTLPKLMEDHDIERMKIKDVGTLYTQSAVRAYILVADVLEAHQWFKDNGHGALVKETVHHSTLKAWVKEQIENGKDVPSNLNAKAYTVARIRKT